MFVAKAISVCLMATQASTPQNGVVSISMT
jgi:hypothetical protein